MPVAAVIPAVLAVCKVPPAAKVNVPAPVTKNVLTARVFPVGIVSVPVMATLLDKVTTPAVFARVIFAAAVSPVPAD